MSGGTPPAGRIVAVDPGKEKCGVAVLEADGGVVGKAVLACAEVAEWLRRALSEDIGVVVLGGGTGGKALARILLPICQARGVPLVTVAETRSTELARLLYFRENRPRGWRRLVPVSFQNPPRPYDDYGAVVIGRGHLERQKAPGNKA